MWLRDLAYCLGTPLADAGARVMVVRTRQVEETKKRRNGEKVRMIGITKLRVKSYFSH